MNERQHDAHVRFSSAQAKVALLRAELAIAEKDLRRKRKALGNAIAADKASWQSTPGLDPQLYI